MTSEAKQGSVMVQHCNVYDIIAMLINAVQICDADFRIRYHFDGKWSTNRS